MGGHTPGTVPASSPSPLCPAGLLDPGLSPQRCSPALGWKESVLGSQHHPRPTWRLPLPQGLRASPVPPSQPAGPGRRDLRGQIAGSHLTALQGGARAASASASLGSPAMSRLPPAQPRVTPCPPSQSQLWGPAPSTHPHNSQTAQPAAPSRGEGLAPDPGSQTRQAPGHLGYFLPF